MTFQSPWAQPSYKKTKRKAKKAKKKKAKKKPAARKKKKAKKKTKKAKKKTKKKTVRKKAKKKAAPRKKTKKAKKRRAAAKKPGLTIRKCPSCKLWTSTFPHCGQCSGSVRRPAATKTVTEAENVKIQQKQGADWRARRGAAGRLRKADEKRGMIPGYTSGPKKAKKKAVRKKAKKKAARRRPATSSLGGVRVHCVREGGRVRVRPMPGQGYSSAKNIQFPKNLRYEGCQYVVDALDDKGSHYRAVGEIRPF
jgi:hypothetical protein